MSDEQVDSLKDEVAELLARMTELEAALKPFADYAEQEPDDVSDDDYTVIEWVSVRDLRQARKILGERE